MAKRPTQKSSVKGASKLPSSAFAYPSKRKYPINTKKRARNALARAAQSGTYGSYSHVRRKVKARYPSIGTKKTTRRRTRRRRSRKR